MKFENFNSELGRLLKSAREQQALTLYELAYNSDIVADHIQKIESAKHGGIQIITYAKLLVGLNMGLSFKPMDDKKTKIFPSTEMQNTLSTLFLDLTKDPNLQFLNFNIEHLLKQIGKEIKKRRKAFGLSEKALAKKAQVSNTTISRVESGKYNFQLRTLYKVTHELKKQNKGFK
ncbi:helix-turn-helix transcriptional regulator [Sulfurovum sp. XGS-02]|uniref:helix-turn-helix domain-containing protein n=1 Tax=Sulfurovum sp. XGS-02 TaxID=2925411 RepID=UPI00205E46C9|nr:helix-turn-helix transcriptional regulator [Sulfurovum sp. XGS-02]UPT76683.1 helix-turn-helix transcriptional regulator [Sulfurovum sp. XGS-02]